MKREPMIEKFGPLQGVRVLSTGVAFAGPFACRWLGDMGAEIIKIEIPQKGDSSRVGRRTPTGVVPKWISMGRNMNSLEFNMDFAKCPEAKQVFIDLVKQCDIWVNSVPNIGKKGATDALVFAANPKMVIVHVTGYGLAQNGGIERYLGKPCVDPIGQAFSTMASMQGMPDGPFLTANPILCDIITAMQAACAGLAAYVSARETGVGQVVDASMYECAAYALSYHWCSQLNGEGNYERSGPLNQLWRPFGYYKCKDARWIAVGVWGPGIWKKFCDLMQVSEDDFPYMDTCGQGNPACVEKMDALWLAWLAAHTADEVEETFLNIGIPVSTLQTAEDALKNPHWQARNDFVQVEDATTGDSFVDIATAPKFCGTPCTVIKGAPLLGGQTDAVLTKILGYTEAQIAELKTAGAVAASLTTK